MREASRLSEKEILIVGVGNEFRGDDGVGPFIARRLRTKNLPGTRIECHSGEGTSLIESWKDVQTVILLDATNSGARHGHVSRFKAHDQPIPSRFFSSLTHNFGVNEAVELARTLNRLPPCLIIYGIEGKNFEEGRGLSSAVRKAAGAVLEMAIKDVDEKIENVSSKEVI